MGWVQLEGCNWTFSEGPFKVQVICGQKTAGATTVTFDDIVRGIEAIALQGNGTATSNTARVNLAGRTDALSKQVVIDNLSTNGFYIIKVVGY